MRPFLPKSSRLLLLSAALFLFGLMDQLPPTARAENELGQGHSGPLTVCQVKRMCLEDLDQLFASGKVGGMPVGAALGPVLIVVTAKKPRLRAQLQSAVWKGKVFFADGSFTNQWLGFQAVPSQVALGASWYDHSPCIVLEYPPGSPVFANARDELREIAPGLLLGRFYERCPCPRFQGYFVLEMKCCCRKD